MLFLNESKNKLGILFFLVVVTFVLSTVSLWKFLPGTNVDFSVEKDIWESTAKKTSDFTSGIGDSVELGMLEFNNLQKEFNRMHKQELLIETTKEYLSNVSTSTEEVLDNN